MKRTRLYRSPREVGLFVLMLFLFAGLFAIYVSQPALMLRNTNIDQAYLVKQAEDTTLYVIDNSHNRLLHLTADGHYLWHVDMPYGISGAPMDADDVAFDAHGNVFVQASDWDSMHIDRELILVYDNRGILEDVLWEAHYECNTVNKHTRFALTVQDKSPCFLQADGDFLTLMGPGGEKESYTYPDAEVRLLDACITDNGVLILDKNGTLQRLSGEDRTILYNAALETGTNRSPYRLTADAAGNIFFTDIRGRCIQKVTDDPAVSQTVVADTDTLTVSVGKDAALLFAEPDAIRTADVSLAQWQWYSNILILRGLALVLLAAAGTLCVYFLYKLSLILRTVRLSNAQRTSILLVISVTVSVSLVSVKLIDSFYTTYQDRIQEELKATAYWVSSLVNNEDISNINTAADFDSESYERLSSQMEWVFSGGGDFYSQIYCNIIRTDGTKNAWAIAYLDRSIGTYYPLADNEIEEVLQVVHTGQSVWDARTSLVSGVFCSMKVPVFSIYGTVTAVIEVGSQTTVLDKMVSDVMYELVRTLLVLLLIIWLAVGELISYTKAEELYHEQKNTGRPVLPEHLIRLLVFLVFTTYNMSASFLPVYIMRTVAGTQFADRELMASLPITMNIFFIGTMALCCAGLLRRISIRTLTIVSALFAMAGNLVIFLFPAYSGILLGLALDGIGMGLVSNSVYVLLTRVKDESERLTGFAIYNAACTSGINFGMMLGSILASNFNQHMVFACVAGMWLIVMGVTVVVNRQIDHLLGAAPDKESAKISVKRFLGNREVLTFIAMIQNPYILFNAFIYYFVPLFCDELGYDETTVSLLLMVYSLLSVYSSASITRAVDRAFGRMAMYLALALNVCAVILFARFQTMNAMILSLILIGLSASFGKSVHQNYFMHLKAVGQYGEDRAIGLYNFTENIGESLGPTIFGKLAVFTPRSVAFTGFSGVIAIISGLHFALFGIHKKKDAS